MPGATSSFLLLVVMPLLLLASCYCHLQTEPRQVEAFQDKHLSPRLVKLRREGRHRAARSLPKFFIGSYESEDEWEITVGSKVVTYFLLPLAYRLRGPPKHNHTGVAIRALFSWIRPSRINVWHRSHLSGFGVRKLIVRSRAKGYIPLCPCGPHGPGMTFLRPSDRIC